MQIRKERKRGRQEGKRDSKRRECKRESWVSLLLTEKPLHINTEEKGDVNRRTEKNFERTALGEKLKRIRNKR